MKRSFASCTAALLALALGAAALPAYALDAGDDRGREGRGEQQGKRLSRDAAAERARRDTGGRVLSIEERQREEREGYRVKILTPDGQIRYYDVEQNGQGRR